MIILAYLDPGSGSALVGAVIAVAGAVLYSLKSFFYRFVRKQTSEQELKRGDECATVAIFSEGKNYWGTFREIVEELIDRKIHFTYYTIDLHDPALLIDNPYMHSWLFDKEKVASFHKLGNIKAKVLLATTPNIGTPGYPLMRPSGVKKMVHVFHAFADISAYHIGSLDNYDVVFTVGSHQDKPIREVEKARALTSKQLIPMGLPYFDYLYHILETSHCNKNNTSYSKSKKTILIGSSWGAKGLLKEYGTGFICELAKSGFDVIVRPHPQSYIAEPDFIEQCMKATSGYENIGWDSEANGTPSMEVSDILISDTSSLRFDYAFLYEKPVITLNIPHEKQLEYEGQYMSEIWTDVAAEKLGQVVEHERISNIVQIVSDVLQNGGGGVVRSFRDETITNLGCSAKAIVEKLLNLASYI